MNYPKPIMSIAEMTKLGFSKDYMIRATHRPSQNYAFKTGGGGKILIDTEKFESWREKSRWN